MTTPAAIQAVGLVLWGVCAAQPWLGGALAGILLLPGLVRLRLPLDTKGLGRIAAVCLLAALGTVATFLVVQGLPAGLLGGAAWLPLPLFPLAIATRLTDAPLRLPHRSGPPQDFAASYLALVLLASGIATAPATWYYWALTGVAVAWLFLAHRPATKTDLAAFALAALLASGLGFVFSNALEQTHQALQEWAVDFLSGADTDPYQSQTRIGNLGRVKLSEGIVWRVQQWPARTNLHLRSGIFTHFNGHDWSARQDAFIPMAPATPGGKPALRLSGTSHAGRVLLPLPLGMSQIDAVTGTLERNALGVVRLSDAPPRVNFTVLTDESPPLPPQAADLALPPRYRDLLGKLPALAGLREKPEAQRLAALESWFGEHFRYTLFLGKSGEEARDLERFLFVDRAGHCEYFASATVLLLRNLGIPARYVTGYSVQEYSTLEKAFLVRQRHAHAWVEAYVNGHWIEVDTTPSTWLTTEEQQAPFWQPLSDFLSYAWLHFVTWRDTLSSDDLLTAATWTVPPLLLFLVAFLWRRLRREARVSNSSAHPADESVAEANPSRIALIRLEAELAALGLPRHAAEPPRRWLQRIAHEGVTVIDAARLQEAETIITAFYHACYGRKTTAS